MDYSNDNLRELLLDNDYPAAAKGMIESVVKQLQDLTPEGKKAFEHWHDTRIVPEFDINGITPAFLREHHHSTDIGIILAYDGLIRNPERSRLLKRPVIAHI